MQLQSHADSCEVTCVYPDFGYDCEGEVTLCGEGTAWNEVTQQCKVACLVTSISTHVSR